MFSKLNFIRTTSSWLLLPQFLTRRSLLLSLSATPTSLKGHRSSGCDLGEPALNSQICGSAQNRVFSTGLSAVGTVLGGIQATSQYNFIDPEALQNGFM